MKTSSIHILRSSTVVGRRIRNIIKERQVALHYCLSRNMYISDHCVTRTAATAAMTNVDRTPPPVLELQENDLLRLVAYNIHRDVSDKTCG